MTDFVRLTIDWYRRNSRELPWRSTKDPYFIWLSEVILQQTRVDQGLGYYLRFTDNYPTVSALASADEEAVLKLWQGLGYYSRARNLHQTAKIIQSEHNGVFPGNYNELLKLRGIGPYTAAAVASFAFGEKKAVVDGNVYRLLSRYFGIDNPIDSGEGKRTFAHLADTLIPDQNPGEFNQAIMEFGALQCTPANPDCGKCPLNNSCMSGLSGLWKTRPKKEKKIRQKDRYFHYFDCTGEHSTIVVQRGTSDVWAKLYEFPMIETSGPELFENVDFEVLAEKFRSKHILSHQRIHATFYSARPKGRTHPGEVVSLEKLQTLPIHRLMHKYLEKLAPGN